MSLPELWPHLVTLRADQQSGSNMAWKVLYSHRNRPLLVPLDIVQARLAVAFFMRNPLLRSLGNLLLTLDRWLPRGHWLPTVRLENFPYSTLFDSSDTSDVTVFCGFPGPLQKLTIYCPDGKIGTGKVAKVALHESANAAIEHEAYWLEKLNRSQPIAAFLPQLLQQGTLPCGRRYISMRAVPQGYSSRKFSEPHYQFLKLLAQQQSSSGLWQVSEAAKRLRERMQQVLPLIDAQFHPLLTGALDETRLIGLTELPTCLIHGDFAPWNMRLSDGQLYVFDWEYAEPGGNPLQDFLHFHLIQCAQQRFPLRTRNMCSLLSKAGDYADTLFGPDSGVAQASGALTIHYLLDTVTFYAAASGYMDTAHPVIRCYLRLLENRALWLPRTADVQVIGNQELQHYG